MDRRIQAYEMLFGNVPDQSLIVFLINFNTRVATLEKMTPEERERFTRQEMRHLCLESAR